MMIRAVSSTLYFGGFFVTDPELRDLVVRQLVDQSSAGQTLLWVVVGGAGLEATLSHPTHSPASIQAQRLTRTAQMALSILHR